MAILNGLRISIRLWLSFALLLILLLAVAAISLSHMNRLTHVSQSLLDGQQQNQYLAQRANQQALTAANNLLLLLQTTDKQQRISLYRQMDEELAASDLSITLLGKALSMSAGNSALPQLVRIKALRRLYNDRFYQTVNLIELDGPEKAHQQFAMETRPALTALLTELRALTSQQQEIMRLELRQLHQDEAMARNEQLVLAIGAIVLGSLLAWRMAGSIIRPVREAVAVAKAIAHGNLQHPVPVGGRDEIGQLLRALQRMRDAIFIREERILHLAYQDDLTGLPNRTRFVEALQSLPPPAYGAVLLFDMDRFSLINHALGQPVGDRLLGELGRHLRAQLQETQLLARLWADQFAIWLPEANLLQAQALATTIVQSLRSPLVIDNQRLDVDGTLGIALYPQDGRDAATLLRRAELAARTAKARRKPMLGFHEVGAEPAPASLSLIGEMREALTRGEFRVFYQPKFNLHSQSMTNAEALIRWQHPVQGMIPPSAFIPFAEQTGFIREITPWLLDQVMRDTAAWRQQGFLVVPAINLSVHDLLDPGLATRISTLLGQHGLPASAICLEITESALMEDPAQALDMLKQLASMGIKLSIDDYGSGQASLAYLKTLPVNELKIDRVFIDGINVTAKNAAIVRSTILLCHELELTVVAEGAETREELEKHNKCDMVQGYVIARPMPLAQFLTWQAPAA